jgi:hypothetical protein
MSDILGNKNIFSDMPQITEAFGNWFSPITMNKVTQTVGVDGPGLVTQTETPFTFNGVVQPLTFKEIMIKPEGQRAWTWLQINCAIPGVLNINDIISYRGQNYKVMALKDYTMSGFVEYHVVHDYQGSGA